VDIAELARVVDGFVREKGWYAPDSPHPQTPRNLAISLSLEASEVLEHFQWGDEAADREALAGELADTLHYLLQLGLLLDLDLEQAVLAKLAANRGRQW
jgi:NTP pyrophosphatase (non-canonical NTP hydrolase)